MAQLFEYAIFVDDLTNDDGKVTEAAEFIERGEVLAKDQETATILVARKIPEEKMEQLERITLAVRPF